MSSENKSSKVNSRFIIIAMYVAIIIGATVTLIVGAMKANKDLVFIAGSIIAMTVCAIIAIT